MEFDFLKQFNPKKGERYIIVENNKPMAVVLSFSDYQGILNNTNENVVVSKNTNNIPKAEEIENYEEDLLSPVSEGETEIDFNEDIEEETEEIVEENKQKVEDLKNELKRELTLDDLPF